MGSSLGMGGLAAFTGYLPLLVLIHRGKSA
jgi:hypothetical protein